MKCILVYLCLFLAVVAKAQESLLKVGDHFPDITISNISNSKIKTFYLNNSKDSKFYILNFWGTWCTACIPEMDSLAKLQKQYASKLQVIAISDDTEERKTKYLKNKPSTIWLATDTNYHLYHMFNFSFVGQSAIINPNKKIVAIVRTDSINQKLIDDVLNGKTVKMSATTKESAIASCDDGFGVDSIMQHSFTVRGYKKGERAMSKLYFDNPNYKGRRITWFNVSISNLYRNAYKISSVEKQESYDSSLKKEIYGIDTDEINKKNNLYCVDILVRPEQKDSLYSILQKLLNENLPIKTRLDKRLIEVYVLKQKPGASLAIKSSDAPESSYWFTGRGYNGTKVKLKDFAEGYLTNELHLPVVDETGLLGDFDIKTNVEQRNFEGIIKSIDALGLLVEKAKREMPVIVYYK
jgi:uncharacterized protein (TIGR03435 family)